ncbi:MAG: hypothetical protein QOF18_2809, partial [Frankiaceae bacterium]|nr:hypothetical protein [Frankiaceae bacterium]
FVLLTGSDRTLRPYQVVEDRSPVQPPLAPLDYDSLTDGVAERQSAFLNYSADINAYGADVVLVGGVAGPLSASGNQTIPPPVAGGTRGVMSARLAGLGLRPAGASASAQSVIADTNTTQEYQTSGQGQTWPYQVVSCLDSGGAVKPQRTTSNGSTSMVSCDLAKARATGTSDAADVAAGPVRIGHSATSASSWRDLVRGAQTTVDASSHAVAVTLPGLGELHIGAIAAHLTTRAHGVAGSSSALYQRNVTGIEIVNPTGKVLFGPAACATTVTAVSGSKPHVADTCQPIARQIDALTQTKLHIGFPVPEGVATPKGAYALIQQSDADFFQEHTVNDQGSIYPKDSSAQRPVAAVQIELYNDSTERSRVLAQFAAVQGDSIFDTTAAHTGPQAPPPGSAPGPKAPAPPPATTVGHPAHLPGGGTTTTTPGTPGQQPTIAAPATGLAGWLFLHRSLRDALLLAGILALAAGAGLLAARRQRLLLAMTTTTTERPRS